MRKRVVGFTIGALALVSACATASRGPAPLEIAETSPDAARRATGAILGAPLGESVAQAEGPRVSIRAEVTQVAAARRVRARFTADDDAYVLVGHVDAEGVVRIVFPADPRDDGFVKGGGRAYETAEVFGGFRDQYMFRYATDGRYYGNDPYAYDGTGGYLFIVAAWQPMHFERFAQGDTWDSFEVTSEAYVRDPRPAIYEFASVLVGDSREAYTVQFAPYYSSLNLSPFGAYSSYSSFGLGLCATSHLGWGQTIPWTYLSVNAPFVTTGFGSRIFQYRGRAYAYDSALGCAIQLPYGYGFTYRQRIAAGPVGRNPTTPITGRTRTLGAGDSPRDPFDPKPTGGRLAPTTAHDAQRASQGVGARMSPEYRRRGLNTANQPPAEPPRQAPRIEPRNDPAGAVRQGRRLDADDARRTPTQPVERARSRDETDRGARTNPSPHERPRVDQSPRTPPAPGSEPRSAQPRSSEPKPAPASRPRTPPPASGGSRPRP
jgi:hypothetical protein